MNLSFSSKKTLFLPKFEVFNILLDYESLDEMEFSALDSSKAVRVGEGSFAEMSCSCKEVVNKDQSQDLESLGYPKPLESMLNRMRLFWLILSRSLSVTYMVQVSGVK